MSAKSALSLRATLLTGLLVIIAVFSVFGVVAIQSLSGYINRMDLMMQINITANHIDEIAGTGTVGMAKDIELYMVDKDKERFDRIEATRADLRASLQQLNTLLPTDAERETLGGLPNLVGSLDENAGQIVQMITDKKETTEINDATAALKDYLDFVHEGVSEFLTAQLALQQTIRESIRTETSILNTAFLAVLGACSVCGFVGFLILIQRSVGKIKHVSDGLRQLSLGEGDLTRRLPVESSDEVGSLSMHFNTFMETMETMIRGVRQTADSSLSIGDDLASNSSETSSATEQIRRNIDGLKSRIDTIDSEVETVTRNTEVLEKSLDLLRDKQQTQSTAIVTATGETTSLLDDARNLAEESSHMQLSAKSLAQIVLSGQNAVTEAVRTMNRLKESSAVITDFLKVISETSQSTNLLAMNASIEAAHAGDFGKGFSVVAMEIRKLAESTEKSSQEIEKSLQAMLEGVRDCDDAIRKTGSAFEGIQSTVYETSAGFEEMDKTIRALDGKGRQVGTALSGLQQSVADLSQVQGAVEESYTRVSEFLQRTARVTGETRAGMEEIAAGVRELEEAAREISNTGQENRDTIGRLEEMVARFKISDGKVHDLQD